MMEEKTDQELAADLDAMKEDMMTIAVHFRYTRTGLSYDAFRYSELAREAAERLRQRQEE